MDANFISHLSQGTERFWFKEHVFLCLYNTKHVGNSLPHRAQGKVWSDWWCFLTCFWNPARPEIKFKLIKWNLKIFNNIIFQFSSRKAPLLWYRFEYFAIKLTWWLVIFVLILKFSEFFIHWLLSFTSHGLLSYDIWIQNSKCRILSDWSGKENMKILWPMIKICVRVLV